MDCAGAELPVHDASYSVSIAVGSPGNKVAARKEDVMCNGQSALAKLGEVINIIIIFILPTFCDRLRRAEQRLVAGSK